MNSTASKQASALAGGLAWGVAAIFVFYQFTLQVSVAVFAPGISGELRLSPAAMGSLTAGFAVAYAVLQIPAGYLLDRFPTKLLFFVAILLCASGSFLFAAAEGWAGLMLGRVLMGAGASFAFVGAGVIAGRWFAPGRFALFVGLAEMLAVFGAGGADLGAAWLQEHTDWRTLLQSMGWFGVGLALLALFLVREAPRKPQTSGRGVPADGSSGATSRLFARTSAVWPAAGFYFFSMGALLGFSGLWNVPFQLSWELSLPMAAGSTALIFFGWGVGSVLAGWVSDATGRRRPVLLLSAVGQGVMMALILFTPMLPYILIWLLRFLLGFFGGMNVVAFAAAMQGVDPARKGFVMGFINTMGFAGVSCLQFLPGFLLGPEEFHSPEEFVAALSIFLAALALAVLFAARIREPAAKRT